MKNIKNMTDIELVESHTLGCRWVINRTQVTGTTKNKLGEPYNHMNFLHGLRRLEEIEDLISERDLWPLVKKQL